VPSAIAAPFFGRTAELDELRQLLADEAVRLVTLTGAGGTGKTRLAQVLTANHSVRDGSAIFFVDLSVVDDPALVPTAVAQALGVQESGSEPLQAILHDVLSQRTVLLVLDNFERVMGAAGSIADLLADAPNLVCLVTSREPLHIRAEQVFPVGPLPVPSEGIDDLEAVGAVPSVALFLDRGRARQHDFALTDENVAIVSEICRRLDGLPLAIELAAAQVSVLSSRAVLARLQARLPFVLGGGPDRPARHQTLRAAVSWSYDLLEPPLQLIFRRCAVFSGTFSPNALAAVAEPAEWLLDPLGALAQLADKNLVQVANAAGDGTRFRLLETIRTFALDMLAAGGELEDLRARHALYFVELAEQSEQALVGPHMGEVLDRLELEYDNFRAVLYWALDGGDVELGMRLAGALHRFWMQRGRLGEARDWFDRALPRSEGLSTEVRAKALNAAGVMAGMQGDLTAAEAFFGESFRLWEAAGNHVRMAAAMGNLGLTAQDRHDVQRALSCFLQAQELYAKGGDRRGIAVSLGSRAHLARQEGDIHAAVSLLEEALGLFRDVGDPRGSANALAHLGQALVALRQWRQAVPYFREALELRRSLGNVLGIAECLEGFAAAAAASRQARRAARLLGAAASLRETTGAPLPKTEKASYEAIVRAARQQLGEETFAREYGVGRTLSAGEAVEYALGSDSDAAPRPHVSAALSRREQEVATLVARGLTNRQIADALLLAPRTVGTHLEHIFAKLGVQTRAEVAAWITRVTEVASR
jgi:predicted ATPase/DNA-binding CsgD family transcriptional regulator